MNERVARHRATCERLAKKLWTNCPLCGDRLSSGPKDWCHVFPRRRLREPLSSRLTFVAHAQCHKRVGDDTPEWLARRLLEWVTEEVGWECKPYAQQIDLARDLERWLLETGRMADLWLVKERKAG